MRKIFLFLGVLILVGFFLPQSSQAKSNSGIKEHVFIQYRAVSKTCTVTRNDQVSNFGWGGWKLQSGLTDFRINYANMPTSLTRSSAFAAIEGSFATLQGAGGGVLFHNAGTSTEKSPTNDGQNTIMWRNLPSSYVAVTYVWMDNNRLVDADTIFNKIYRWAYTGYNGTNDCSGVKSAFDLRDIGTHEFGHWMGLGDLYDSRSRDLTMYGYTARGELKKDTLGLGDEIGVRAVWP